MDLIKVKNAVGKLPCMSFARAEILAKFIETHQLKDLLELGFAHGVSSCYMAAVLDQLGRGSLTTIDVVSSKSRSPNIEQLLERLCLRDRVEIFYEPTSYTWRLMKMLETCSEPRFDFCYIDGAHDWFVDGLAFFLVDRLLKPGGWIIFDDLNWSFSTSPSQKNSKFVKEMPADERETKQVLKIFDLLVRTHPGYGEIHVDQEWGYARKVK